LGDSSGTAIVVNEQVDTSVGTPGFLAVSPSGDYIASSFGSAGAKLFSSNRSSPIFAPVIGAVVGSVVVGSVAAVGIASAVAPVAGSIGATGGTQAGGIIGTQAVSSVPMNAPINVDVGALQPNFKAIMWYISWLFTANNLLVYWFKKISFGFHPPIKVEHFHHFYVKNKKSKEILSIQILLIPVKLKHGSQKWKIICNCLSSFVTVRTNWWLIFVILKD